MAERTRLVAQKPLRPVRACPNGHLMPGRRGAQACQEIVMRKVSSPVTPPIKVSPRTTAATPAGVPV